MASRTGRNLHVAHAAGKHIAFGFSRRAKAHAGIARRAGRSPSAARKLPEQKPRSPRGVKETGKPKRGASGGMQGGPRRGRSPITGPALPTPEAAQTKIKKSPRARRAQKLILKGQTLLCFFLSARRAYPRRPPRTHAARRAGGQKNIKRKAPVSEHSEM